MTLDLYPLWLRFCPYRNIPVDIGLPFMDASLLRGKLVAPNFVLLMFSC